MNDDLNDLSLKVLRAIIRRPIFFILAIFLPAWTWDYWQAWLFLSVFFTCECTIIAYLYVKDKRLLARRLKAGSRVETRFSQKVIMKLAAVTNISILCVAGLDHHFDWSLVPVPLIYATDVLVVISFYFTLRVFRENTFATATIQITGGQKVISTGPYAIVRHPMYSAAIVINLCMPIALGSWWGLPVSMLNFGLIIWRLKDEEKMLRQDLPGYTDYCSRVRHRLIPYLW